MFTKSVAFYDAIYAATGKDYAREIRALRRLIGRHKRSPGRRLLDVACGTGHHLAGLRRGFQVEGLDLDPRMLAVARRRLPGVRLHRADMVRFNLRRRFDVVLCLFSSIGYARTVRRLRQSLQTFASHTTPGGVVIVEPWIFPEKFEAGHLGAVFVNQPNLKIARINTSTRRRKLSTLRFRYLVGTRTGIEHFAEDHELGLFAHRDYLRAFTAAGLDVHFVSGGLTGRSLYVGGKPADRDSS